MSFKNIDGLFPDLPGYDKIWWTANSLDELVGDGVLPEEEGQNLVDSLYDKKEELGAK